jgi:hypothetical protein
MDTPESRDVATVATDAGLLALWRASAFDDVHDYPTWERRVEDRLGEAIRSGELVPVGIQGDGAFGVRVAVAPEGLTERETRYTVVTSDPYLLHTDGGDLCLSSVEVVGDRSRSPWTGSVPAGRYAVRVVLVGWDEEPGARGPDGSPGPSALADFVVLVAPADGTETFRTAQATFDPP